MAAENVKRSGVIAYGIATILSLAALAAFLESCGFIAIRASGHALLQGGPRAQSVIWLSAGAAACALLTAILSMAVEQRGLARLLTDLLRVAAPVLVMAALARFIADNADVFGALRSLRPAMNGGETAAGQALCVALMYAAAWLACAVSAFVPVSRKRETGRE